MNIFIKKGKAMEKLIEILTSLHPDVDFENNDALIDDGILDSLDIVSLVTEINAEFDVTIPAEEIIPENPRASRPAAGAR